MRQRRKIAKSMLYVSGGAVVDGPFGAVHSFQTCPLRIVAARSTTMVASGDPCKGEERDLS
jgi:hypothetical protein